MIRQAIVEDIMDKEIENPKTGNKIKVRTALQLPDEHPANKKAKDMVAKTPTKDDDEPMAATPAPKGKSKGPMKNPFSKESPAFEPKQKEINKELIKKSDDIVKQFQNGEYESLEDLVMNAHPDEIQDSDIFNKIPDVGQNFDAAMEYYYDLNDHEMGVGAPADYDEDQLKNARKELFKALTTSKDKEDTMQQPFFKISYTDSEGREKTDSMRAKTPEEAKKDFINMNKGRGFKVVKVQKESVNESKQRRYTVKEVRMWMKKLEENRYKKVYNSDARRVAWMVNNEGVSLDEMPISMKKKWTKAQYGRERYLATEFLKSKSEQMNEGKLTEASKKWSVKVRDIGYVLVDAGGASEAKRLVAKKLRGGIKDILGVTKALPSKKVSDVGEEKLREQIREIIKEQLNEKSFGDIRKIKFDKKDGKKIVNIVTSKKYKLTKPLYKTKGKDIELHVPKKEYNKAVEFFMKNKLNPRG